MQVNSSQDYLTARKRQLHAKAIRTTPISERTPSLYTSALGNGATQVQRFVAPFQGAWRGASGGATYTSLCCSTGGPLALGFVTDAGVVRFNVLPPLSVTATRVKV